MGPDRRETLKRLQAALHDPHRSTTPPAKALLDQSPLLRLSLPNELFAIPCDQAKLTTQRGRNRIRLQRHALEQLCSEHPRRSCDAFRSRLIHGLGLQ